MLQIDGLGLAVGAVVVMFQITIVILAILNRTDPAMEKRLIALEQGILDLAKLIASIGRPPNPPDTPPSV